MGSAKGLAMTGERLSPSPHSWKQSLGAPPAHPSRKLPWSFHSPSGCLDIIPFTERLSSSCLVNSPLAQKQFKEMPVNLGDFFLPLIRSIYTMSTLRGQGSVP